ncbi:hypothetical protein CYMTET_52090 [Cymbomonas tetramitiformis]|uniref:Uncharacterized protein n=1 Tax=Cymbomonas tetramitiformis TaxID=36881 RepID=A0AAE0BL54_9CHLO|nr:hypothetical protein CYMTET_52090 [Cymbomonas tetramitiformis]
MGYRLGSGFVVAMFIHGFLHALIPLATEFWVGDLGTFDFDDIFLCPSLAWLDRSVRICDVAFSPRPYPNVLQRTASPQAYLEMGVTTRSKKSLTRDSDIDASQGLIDGVYAVPFLKAPATAIVYNSCCAFSEAASNVPGGIFPSGPTKLKGCLETGGILRRVGFDSQRLY